VLPVQGSS